MNLRVGYSVWLFSIERYVSSKELRLVNDSPDRFYDISPSCKVGLSSSRPASHLQRHTHTL